MAHSLRSRWVRWTNTGEGWFRRGGSSYTPFYSDATVVRITAIEFGLVSEKGAHHLLWVSLQQGLVLSGCFTNKIWVTSQTIWFVGHSTSWNSTTKTHCLTLGVRVVQISVGLQFNRLKVCRKLFNRFGFYFRLSSFPDLRSHHRAGFRHVDPHIQGQLGILLRIVSIRQINTRWWRWEKTAQKMTVWFQTSLSRIKFQVCGERWLGILSVLGTK